MHNHKTLVFETEHTVRLLNCKTSSSKIAGTEFELEHLKLSNFMTMRDNADSIRLKANPVCAITPNSTCTVAKIKSDKSF